VRAVTPAGIGAAGVPKSSQPEPRTTRFPYSTSVESAVRDARRTPSTATDLAVDCPRTVTSSPPRMTIRSAAAGTHWQAHVPGLSQGPSPRDMISRDWAAGLADGQNATVRRTAVRIPIRRVSVTDI